MSKRADRLTIRRAQSNERQSLEDLQRRASLALPDYRAELEANPEAIHLPAEHLPDTLVAEDGGQVVGFAVLLDGELDGLFVEPSRWREGLGAALIDVAVHHARCRGLSLSVVASPSARGFYERCGFSVEGEEATRFGPALRMSR